MLLLLLLLLKADQIMSLGQLKLLHQLLLLSGQLLYQFAALPPLGSASVSGTTSVLLTNRLKPVLCLETAEICQWVAKLNSSSPGAPQMARSHATPFTPLCTGCNRCSGN